MTIRRVERLGLCADVLRGKDGRHAVDGAASGSSRPKSEANPDRRARTLYNILALLTEKNGARYGSRVAHGERTLLIKVMNFNFGDIDVIETKFEEFNLLIKDHDDISSIDNVPDTIKRAILVARAPEPLRTQFSSEQSVVFNLP